MKRQELNDTIAKISELYISARKRYIIQTQQNYITLDGYKNPSVWTLTDSLIERHLKGVNTYGVFNGNSVNKFITFDVDYADDQVLARWSTLKLIYALENDFNIPSTDIHVSFSGNKGYHVDLFFDVPISSDDAKSFYRQVIKIADLPSEKVEYRPTYAQAVKLPLGINQKTGARCWFVDRETLEPIESFDYLNDVEPMDHALILDALIELTPEQEAEFREVVERTNVDVTAVSHEKAQSKVIGILKAGQLLFSNTRHETTVLLAAFCNSQGYGEAEAIDLIMSILIATPSEYFSEGSTAEYWQKETERIVKMAFERGYKLGNDDMAVKVYKSEILAVLGVGTFRQKQLAYAMLITSKRYGKTFYLTTRTAMRMIETKSHETIQSAVKRLVEVGFIEYARKGEIDRAKSSQMGHAFYKPNRYRILIDKPQADDKSVDVLPNQSLVDVTYQLLDIKELRRVISRKELGNRWAR